MTSYLCRSFASFLKINPILNRTKIIINQTNKPLANFVHQTYYSIDKTKVDITAQKEPNEPLTNVAPKINSFADSTKEGIRAIEDLEDPTENLFETKEYGSKFSVADREEALKNHKFGIAKANIIGKMMGWQPTSDTHSSLTIDGVPYEQIHIVSIKSSKNNTILSLTEHTGNILYTTSAGSCGFKNSKKSTAVAGQSAGLALSEIARRKGVKNIRVIVKGFGNGRLSSIKALQMGKLNIVSITDKTPIPLPFAKPPRPPAKRRV